jgi:hypothetical protein
VHKNQFKAAAIFHEDKLFNLIDTQKGSYKNIMSKLHLIES